MGAPDWIVANDPDGYSGNFPVLFYRPEWRVIVDAAVDRVVADGYDGIYMDWVEAGNFEPVVARAKEEGVDSRAAMVDLVRTIRDRARATRADFRVVAQNATWLGGRPGYLALLDGEAQEQVFFDGLADKSGADPQQGDCRLPLFEGDAPPADNPPWCAALAGSTRMTTSEGYVRGLARYLAAGVPVLVVDYALRPANAAYSHAQHRRFHFVGLVSMRSLEDLTATPPPGL